MYNNYGFNPYYNGAATRFQPTVPTIDPSTQQMPNQSFMPPTNINKPNGLLGKSVDSIDVVKAMDIPLDGSVSYFPLTDNSAIVTKQLMNDGTSKTTIYKPIEEEKKEDFKFATIDDLKKSIQEIDLSEIDDLKDELKELKQEIKDLKKLKKKED